MTGYQHLEWFKRHSGCIRADGVQEGLWGSASFTQDWRGTCRLREAGRAVGITQTSSYALFAFLAVWSVKTFQLIYLLEGLIGILLDASSTKLKTFKYFA